MIKRKTTKNCLVWHDLSVCVCVCTLDLISVSGAQFKTTWVCTVYTYEVIFVSFGKRFYLCACFCYILSTDTHTHVCQIFSRLIRKQKSHLYIRISIQKEDKTALTDTKLVCVCAFINQAKQVAIYFYWANCWDTHTQWLNRIKFKHWQCE